MYNTYVRPFKSALNNVVLIYEEVMTLVCIVILFRYANKDSVVSSDTSKATAKQFALCVLLLTIVPPMIAFMEFIRMLRYIREICNWKRDYPDERASDQPETPPN
jgi:hypothetical protein